MKKQLHDFKETIVVDDYVEIKNMIKELEVLEPEMIETILIPRLQKVIDESNGRLKCFYIWPQHRVGGMDLIYPNGCRYPKRLRDYKH